MADLLQVMKDDGKTAKLPADLKESDVKKMYEAMIMIRAYDERALKLQRSGRIGFCVTSFGEEATQIGTAAALETTDWVFPSYRQYGVPIYRGVPLEILTAHLFGNEDDLVKGRQMPAHYSYKEKNFVSISSVIGTQIIQAVGCAMAAKIRGDKVISCTYFGDGATSSNDFHSGLNFAGVYKAPVLFFCVNNQYAISLPVSKQTAVKELHMKGEAYGVNSVRVDGNDIIAVYQATKAAADRARDGQGPTLLELLTYRTGSHSSSDDPSRYRAKDESDSWAKKDPVERMKRYLQQVGIWSETYEEQIWEESRFRINKAITDEENKPQPAWKTMFENVYAEMPQSLADQCEELLRKESHLTLNNEGEFPL